MELKKGYKQTEVGVIPEDWEVAPLRQDFDKLEAGVSVNSVDEELNSYSHDQYILKTSAIFGGQFFPNERKKIILRDLARVRLFPRIDTILISRMNTPDLVGECGYIEVDYPNLFLPDRLWMTKKSSGSPCCVRWLNYLLSSKIYKNKIKGMATGTSGSMKNISKEAILNLLIPAPPPCEQRAIASALSDVDALLKSLDRLIAKKRDIKQAAMQQLLTGKKRLPGFEKKNGHKQTEIGVIPEDWDVKKLADLTNLMTNGFVGTATFHYVENENGVIYIQGYNVEENSFNLSGVKFVSHEFHKNHMKSCLQQNDLLTIQTGDVGLTTFVPKSLEGANCHALIISRFGQKKTSPIFVSYYLNSKQGRSRLSLIETGTTMKHLNVGDLLEFKIPSPSSIEEQIAIAKILSDMDSEIAALEKRREKTKSIKQAMMQELLTGKTRLV